MGWKDDIKKRIDQIRKSEITILKEFPNKDNFNRNSYRKSLITCLFIDISGYTEICDKSKDDKK